MPEKDQNKEEEDLDSIKEFVEKNYWKLRSCNDYDNELSQCTSIKGRFHQYFVYGEFLDCSKWKEDYKNCEDAIEDVRKCARIIKHEDERMEKRLKDHLENDVWERRDEPPDNWNAELPDWMKERQEDFSVFKMEEKKFCVIS